MSKKDKLDIIYEDKEIIVVNKPSKLLTISTENEKEKTLFHKVITYQKKKNKNNKFFASANDHKNIMKKSWPNE